MVYSKNHYPLAHCRIFGYNCKENEKAEMSVIMCELCGSNEMVKQGEFYDCQGCGSQYALVELRSIS